MKTLPDIIYLQTGEEEDDLFGIQEVTWCQDRIFDSDVVYARRDSVVTEVMAILDAETNIECVHCNSPIKLAVSDLAYGNVIICAYCDKDIFIQFRISAEIEILKESDAKEASS